MEGMEVNAAPAAESNGLIGETPAPQEQEAPKRAQDDFSRRFELLARKERELMEISSRYKSQEQQWKEKEDKLRQYEEDYGSIERDPLSFLSKHGWTTDRLAEHMINNAPDPYASKYEQKIGDLERRLDEERQERINELRSRTYHQKINEVKEVISKDMDRFELVNGHQAHDLVLNTMAEYYNKFGEALDAETAADQVEKYLEKQLDDVVKYKKVQSKLGQFNRKPEEDLMEEQQSIQPQQRRPSTLTNSFAPVNVPNSNRSLSREESLRRAAALIKWND